MAKDCGRKTVAVVGNPEPLAAPGVSGEVWIQAFASNTGRIAVGCPPDLQLPNRFDRTVGPVAATTNAQRGFQLRAEESIILNGDLSTIWIDATVAGEGVAYLVK